MLWAEVYNAAGVQQGEGPILIESMSVARRLDGPGQISVKAPYDPHNESVLKNERRIFVYKQDFQSTRLLASGIIKTVKRKGGTSKDLSVSGIDLLDELKYENVLLVRKYDNVAFATVAQSLAGLAGWTATVESGANAVEARFDGATVLKALQTLASGQGRHLRLGLGVREVELGAFGQRVNLTLMNGDSALAESRDDIAIIRDVDIETESKDVVNWLLPVGAGEGEAALTLKSSTRTGIQTLTGPDGRTLYFVLDAASIAEFGFRKKVGVFKEIAPLNNTAASKVVAANALYDQAQAYLRMNSQAVKRYSCKLMTTTQTIRPGDKVRMMYMGPVREVEGTRVLDRREYETIDEDLWVISVNESHGANSPSIMLELATIDREKQDPATAVVSALETLEVRNLKPQAYPYWSENTYVDTIQAVIWEPFGVPPNNKWANFKLDIDNSVTTLTRVRLRVKTKPLYTLTFSRNELQTTSNANAVSPHSHTVPSNFPAEVFSANDGNNYPSGLSIWINGIDRTSELGGPWNPPPTNAPLNFVLDITDYIVEASGGMYQEHTIQFRCQDNQVNVAVQGVSSVPSIIAGGSQGFVELNIRVQGTAQAIVSS